MIVVLASGASAAQKREVFDELERLGLRWREIDVLDMPLLHIVDGPSRAARGLTRFEAVRGLEPTPGPRIRARGRYFFPYHMINWITALLLVFAGLILLAGLLPPLIGGDIDRAGSLSVTALPWYLRAPHVFLARGWLGALALVGSIVLLFVLPVFDRARGGNSASRALVVAASLVLFFGWVFLTVV